MPFSCYHLPIIFRISIYTHCIIACLFSQSTAQVKKPGANVAHYRPLGTFIASCYHECDAGEQAFDQATTGEINYYFNAQLTTTYHRKEALDQKNILTTPIFTKTYWLASFNQENLEALRVDYQETLKRKLNQNYLQLLQAIKSLPSAIDANEFAKQLALLHAQCPPESAQALLAYGAKWHVLF